MKAQPSSLWDCAYRTAVVFLFLAIFIGLSADGLVDADTCEWVDECERPRMGDVKGCWMWAEAWGPKPGGRSLGSVSIENGLV